MDQKYSRNLNCANIENLIQISDKTVDVAMSNSKCDEILELYSNFFVNDIQVNRSISSNKNNRGIITEAS